MSKNLSYEEFEELEVGDRISVTRVDTEYRAVFEGFGLDGEGNEIISLYNEDASEDCSELVEGFGSDYTIYKGI